MLEALCAQADLLGGFDGLEGIAASDYLVADQGGQTTDAMDPGS